MEFALNAWRLLRDTVEAFIADDALSRGASIAYYTIFSIAPVLLVVVAIAGSVFGRDAAEGAIVQQLSGLMGHDTAVALQGMIKSAAAPRDSLWATLIGIAAIIVTVTGVFSQIQSSLNAVWKIQSHDSAISRLVRARLVSLGLVATAGFLLTVSLAASAGLAAVSDWLKVLYPAATTLMHLVDIAMSALLIGGLFAAIYKVLPDTDVTWRDVGIGALVTTLLFEAGKYLIAFYIGQSNVASTYGAAGALIILLLWIYYSAQIFLFGAEFTYAFAHRFGSKSG